MLKFYAHFFVKLSRGLESLKTQYATQKHASAASSMTQSDRDLLARSLPKYKEVCELIRLNSCARHLDRMITDLHIPEINYLKMIARIEELQNRIEDELSGILFLQLDTDKARYYDQKHPLFGLDVSDKFPSAIIDIMEACKCLALGRDTACVFHLMRVMEVGLKALAKALGIPYSPSWESYLKQINDKVSQKYKKKGIKWKRDEPFFKDVAGDLLTIKIAWRNPTMHVVRNYGSEEAETIFNAIKSFMKRLSTRFSESP